MRYGIKIYALCLTALCISAYGSDNVPQSLAAADVPDAVRTEVQKNLAVKGMTLEEMQFRSDVDYVLIVSVPRESLDRAITTKRFCTEGSKTTYIIESVVPDTAPSQKKVYLMLRALTFD